MVSSGVENTGIDHELFSDFSLSIVKRFADELAEKPATTQKIGTNLDVTGDKTESEGGMSILEVQSDGVSCIRYAKEVRNIQKVFATNCSEDEIKSVDTKISNHGVGKLVESVCETPLLSLYAHRKHSQRCQVVDLTALPNVVKLLDAAVQSVADGGLLLVSFSDPALLSAADPATCYRRYGATNVDGSHETALRVALTALELHANRHGRVTVPTASKWVGETLAVCVRLHIGPVRCKQSLSKTSLVFRCDTCNTSTLHALGAAELISEKPQRFKFTLPRGPPVPTLCHRCQQPHQVGGPVWNAELGDDEVTLRPTPPTEGETSEAGH